MTVIHQSVLEWTCEEYPDSFSTISLMQTLWHYDYSTTYAYFCAISQTQRRPSNTSHSSKPRSRKNKTTSKSWKWNCFFHPTRFFFAHCVHDSYLLMALLFAKTKLPSSFAWWPQDLHTTLHYYLVIWMDIRTCCCERLPAYDKNTQVHGKHIDTKWECSLHKKDWSLSWGTLFECYLNDTCQKTSMWMSQNLEIRPC